jgi:DNA-binding NarL/FixJ family response regulator
LLTAVLSRRFAVVKNFMKKSEVKKLSPREIEILPLLADGLRYKEIADELNVSIETIRTHVRNMYIKLEVSSRTDALNKIYPRSF